jgi:hypothetical protein
MSDTINELDLVENGLAQVERQLARGEKQAETRDDVIKIIDRMCDALQHACSLISDKLTESILEYNRIQRPTAARLQQYFSSTARRFSNKAIGKLLHEGHVCGELHMLGDRYSQPFSKQTMSTLSFTENVRTFFRRTNSMHQALWNLEHGERQYLRDFETFLVEIRTAAAQASGNVEQLKSKGDALVELMRNKHKVLQQQALHIRERADACFRKMH